MPPGHPGQPCRDFHSPLHRMGDLAGFSEAANGGRVEAGEVAALMQTGAVHSTDPGVLDTFEHFGREEVDLMRCRSEAIDGRNLGACMKLVVSPLVRRLDTRHLWSLEYLDIGDTGITSLDTRPLQSLRQLGICETEISSLDTSGLGNLQVLYAPRTKLTSLDTRPLASLRQIYAGETQIGALDTRPLGKLEDLSVPNTRIKYLTTTGLASLKELDIYGTQISRIHIVPGWRLKCLLTEGSGIRFADGRGRMRVRDPTGGKDQIISCGGDREGEELFEGDE